MLTFFIVMVSYLAVTLSYGRLFLGWIAPGRSAGIVMSVFVGVALTTSMAATFSLISALNAFVFLLIVTPAILFLLRNRRSLILEVRESVSSFSAWTVLILTGLFWFAVMHNAVLPVANFDTGLYHAQSIQWMEKYPAVPGLANLHGRFGFNSNWFVANAWFSLSFLKVADIHLITAVVFGFFLGHTLLNFIKSGPMLHEYPGALWGGLLIPAGFYALASDISSPGTDLPAALLIWVCVWLMLTQPDSSEKWVSLAILPVFGITVKLSLLPLLAFSILGVYKLWVLGHRRNLFFAVGMCLFVLLPWIARNFILTGYPVYPQTYIDVINVDWKVPLESVAEERDAVIAWARSPRSPIEVTASLPFNKWFRPWFLNLSMGQKLLIWGALISPAFAFWLGFQNRFQRERVFVTLAALYAGFVYWIYSAPAIRFGYGYLLGLVLLSVACMFAMICKWLPGVMKYLHALVGVVVAMYLCLFLIQSFDGRILDEYLIFPAPYRNLPTEPCRIQGGTILVGQEYGQCWNVPIPCAPYCNPSIELRGESIREGFRSP